MTDTAAAARPLRALWGALTAGGLTALVALTALGIVQSPPAPSLADTAFYVCAVYGVVALGVAFALLRRMQDRASEAPSDAAAIATIRGHGAAALAAVESSAVLAGAVVFLTGNVLAVAFGIPLVAFAAITWPTEERVAGWLALRRR